jgi:hypothetical protein
MEFCRMKFLLISPFAEMMDKQSFRALTDMDLSTKNLVNAFWIIGWFLSSVIVGPVMSHAATSADVDRLTTYAVILGRATGCGIDTERAAAQVGAWMDKRFPPGSKDQRIYLPIFVEGWKMHAERQRSGRSPDTCSQVQREFDSMKWGR